MVNVHKVEQEEWGGLRHKTHGIDKVRGGGGYYIYSIQS